MKICKIIVFPIIIFNDCNLIIPSSQGISTTLSENDQKHYWCITQKPQVADHCDESISRVVISADNCPHPLLSVVMLYGIRSYVVQYIV